MHAAVKLEKYSTVTNPQPVAIRMISEFLDTLAIRKISQRLNFCKNSFAHGSGLDFLNLLNRPLKNYLRCRYGVKNRLKMLIYYA